MTRRRGILRGLVALPLAAGAPRLARAAATPLRVAAADRLVQPWSAVRFEYRKAGDPQPGILIRLPADRWYASSMVCPHAQCETIYFPDPQTASDTLGVDVVTPVLGCPCHFSVFDIAHGGAVMAGPAPGPLERLEVSLAGGEVYVTPPDS